jgi:hypothetical protein
MLTQKGDVNGGLTRRPTGDYSPIMKSRLRVSIGLAFFLSACAASRPGEPTASADSSPDASITVQPAAIEAHMRYLASDLLEGREAGTRGYDLAAAYVASQFQQLGLRPAGDDGGYFQRVALLAYWLERNGVRLTVHPARGSRIAGLALGTDFIISPSATHQTGSVRAPAVFVGYGIDAPAFGHDDYSGLDVSGKIAVALTGYPPSFPSEEGAHYGSGRERLRAAANRGAIGLISIYTERFEAVAPWDLVTSNIDAMSSTWIRPDGLPFDPEPRIEVSALIAPTKGAVLFAGAPRSYEQVRQEAAKGAPKGFPLAVSLEVAQASRHERRTSANVAAVLDGALDNAAGIAGLLEAARFLAGLKPAPRRSILFLAVTAEEKGLIGSEYFAHHPTVPRDRIVAAVNLDMPVLTYDFTDVVAFGAEHSSLKGTVEAALVDEGLTLTPDPMPDQAIFTRSDHYSLVQQGIPSIFLTTGWNTTSGKGEGGKAFLSFLSTHYHRPSDDMTLPLDFAAGAKFARVNARILLAIANAAERPRWNDRDFFGTLFEPR